MRRDRMSREVVWAFLATAVLVFLGPVAGIAPVASAEDLPPGTWMWSGNLATARGFAPAVLLADGSVLTAGGSNGSTYFASAERWNPSSRTWSSAGSIGQPAVGQVASILPNGKVLFAGGTDDMSYYRFGDVYDPVARTWTKTPAMAHAHAYAAGATLTGGNVLVIGGYDGGGSLLTTAVDVYSAAAGTWSAGPKLPGGAGRFAMTATTLGNGTVLVAGGNNGATDSTAALTTVVTYSPGTGWSAANPMKTARFDHASARLGDGRVLVAGGSDGTGKALATAEIYDPNTGQWTLTGSMLAARFGLTLSTLADGHVLAVGGYSSASSPALASAELYDPKTGHWAATGPLAEGRRYQSATVLSDGRVLVVGGHGSGQDAYLASSELYTPPEPPLVYSPTTFYPIAPARILDTRSGNGLSGAFRAGIPRMLQVTGRGGVPDGAAAVTGILTVTKPTTEGWVAIGPIATSAPGSSTLNFPAGDNRANNVTVALDAHGRLAAVYIPNGAGTTQLIFDVTGYFMADDKGATFKTLAPSRLLDSRNGTGVSRATFKTGVARTFQVTGHGGVPAEAVAVTGNLTLVRPSAGGWAFVGPSIPADPTTMNCSTVNSPAGDIRADGVTVALGTGGTLSAVWVGSKGSTADLVFDVTGYFVHGLGGAHFVPMEPARLVDTRYKLPFAGPIRTGVPVTVAIAGRGGIPSSATGISGNLTVTGQTYQGYLTISPKLTGDATTSTLNFPAGDNRANGFDVSLATTGTVSVVYVATATSSTTQFIIDVTGYFTP